MTRAPAGFHSHLVSRKQTGGLRQSWFFSAKSFWKHQAFLGGKNMSCRSSRQWGSNDTHPHSNEGLTLPHSTPRQTAARHRVNMVSLSPYYVLSGRNKLNPSLNTIWRVILSKYPPSQKKINVKNLGQLGE